MALVVAGFLSQAYGMALRVMISGRPPVTNMYESVVWVAFGAVLFALVFEAVYKVRYLRRLRLRPRGRLPDPGRQRADPRRLDLPARAGAARQHVAHRSTC